MRSRRLEGEVSEEMMDGLYRCLYAFEDFGIYSGYSGEPLRG